MPQWFCCQSRSGCAGWQSSLWTHWPTSFGSSSGMKSAATSLLIGVHVAPASSVRNPPAAEIAT